MGKTNRKTANKILTYSEEARGHARARHSAPTLPAGPSIDAYLKSRFPNNAPNGRTMSAFYNDQDQDRAVGFAYDQTDTHALDGARTVMTARTGGTLNSITVRVVEKIGGTLEGYDAKLREVKVVVENHRKNGELIITAYPSGFFRV